MSDLLPRVLTAPHTLFTRTAIQNRSRAVVKTLLYRVFMIVITVAVALVVTGNVGQALSIGLVTNVVKTGTYYGYERIWDHVNWGIQSGAA